MVGLWQPPEGGRPQNTPKGNGLILRCKYFTRKSEDGTLIQIGGTCETITSNTSNPISKTPHKRSQENQRERGIPNKVGNTCDKLYRNVLKVWISRDK